MAAGTEAVGGRSLPRVHWGAVVAGIFLAIATDIVLSLFGGWMGLAAGPAGPGGLGAGTVIWGIATPFVATLLGAWLAIRVAAIADDRPGSILHAVMVWSVGLIAGAMFFTGTIAAGAMTAAGARAGSLGPAERIFRGELGRPAVSAEQAATAAAGAMGFAALASIGGLLGGFAGVGVARSRRAGRGFGWRLSVRREERAGERYGPRPGERERAATYGESYPPPPPEPRRDVGASPPTSDPHHH